MSVSMMSMESLLSLFGWMTVINFGLLIFSTIILIGFKKQVLQIHGTLTGLDDATLMKAYLYFLAFYKVLIITFNLVPYLALRLL